MASDRERGRAATAREAIIEARFEASGIAPYDWPWVYEALRAAVEADLARAAESGKKVSHE